MEENKKVCFYCTNHPVIARTRSDHNFIPSAQHIANDGCTLCYTRFNMVTGEVEVSALHAVDVNLVASTVVTEFNKARQREKLLQKKKTVKNSNGNLIINGIFLLLAFCTLISTLFIIASSSIGNTKFLTIILGSSGLYLLFCSVILIYQGKLNQKNFKSFVKMILDTMSGWFRGPGRDDQENGE